MVQELEKKLQEYWKVKNVICVSNGTMATMLAIKALGITKEIYVSPYSYISTVSVPTWMGIKTKFIDIGEKWKGPAIVTHVYGAENLQDVKPVIYDASHAFCVKHKGKSIVSYGDISIISFHAVKIFQTIEGGALVTNDDRLAKKLRWMRNFGYKTHYSYYGAGINAKMNEFEAAMGLCSLEQIDKIEKKYALLIKRYNKALGYDYHGLTYYPIWYETEKNVLKAIKTFEKNGITPRRYFYPPLNKVFNGKACPIAEDLMSRVLCIPLYYDLTTKQQDHIIKIAKQTNGLIN